MEDAKQRMTVRSAAFQAAAGSRSHRIMDCSIAHYHSLPLRAGCPRSGVPDRASARSRREINHGARGNYLAEGRRERLLTVGELI